MTKRRRLPRGGRFFSGEDKAVKNDFLQRLEARPVIAAVRDPKDMETAVRSRAAAVFLLGGSLMTLPGSVERAKASGKYVFVHLDLCDGLGKDAAAVDWIALAVRPDGLISTRQQLLRRAREHGLMTIQRLFLMDSESLRSGVKLISSAPPDLVEVLPGLVPKAIRALRERLGLPVIAGGMVTERADVEQALAAGAAGVSSSVRELWSMEEKG